MLIEIPTAITLEFINSLNDKWLSGILYSYVLEVRNDLEAIHGKDYPESKMLAELPYPLAANFRLTLLMGNVHNGGFQQFFASQDYGEAVLKDLRTIGAMSHLDVTAKAVALNQQLEDKHPCYAGRLICYHDPFSPLEWDACWTDFKANFWPEFDRLTSEFYGLDSMLDYVGNDPLAPHLDRYLRAHAADCVHHRCVTE